MPSELVERLRLLANDFEYQGRLDQGAGGNHADAITCKTAADRIEELEAEVERVRRHEVETAEAANRRIEELEGAPRHEISLSREEADLVLTAIAERQERTTFDMTLARAADKISRHRLVAAALTATQSKEGQDG